MFLVLGRPWGERYIESIVRLVSLGIHARDDLVVQINN